MYQVFAGLAAQKLPNASLTNNTAPTFAGIVSVTPENSGAFTVTWGAASGAFVTPADYDIYVALGTVLPAALFVSSNIVDSVKTLTAKIFTLADQTTYFVNGLTYTFGVRARSAYNIQETNTATIQSTAIASGNMASVFQTLATGIAATEVLLAADEVNFSNDHLDFASDHNNFVDDHNNFVDDHNNFVTDINQMGQIISSGVAIDIVGSVVDDGETLSATLDDQDAIAALLHDE
jgi:hypothetical protein